MQMGGDLCLRIAGLRYSRDDIAFFHSAAGLNSLKRSCVAEGGNEPAVSLRVVLHKYRSPEKVVDDPDYSSTINCGDLCFFIKAQDLSGIIPVEEEVQALVIAAAFPPVAPPFLP